MNHEQSSARSPRRLMRIEGVIVAAILVILAGLVVPAVHTLRLYAAERRARADLSRIRRGILDFIRDTGCTPTRGRDGEENALFRLNGPGLVASGSYFASYGDQHQGQLANHLLRNEPRGRGQPGYPGWRGPYVDALTADPWGAAYVVVAYPLTRDDDRDCIVVSAGPNGRMDGSYSSPRDVIAAGDDLLEVIVDKSPERRRPVH